MTAKRIQQFGTKKALKSRTPTWANNAVALTILGTSVATFIIASDPTISSELALKIGIYLKGIDMFVAGAAKLWGVTQEEIK